MEPLHGPEGSLVRREAPAVVKRIQDREPFRFTPLGKHVLDPSPSGARRPHVGASFEASLQAIEAMGDDIDSGKRLPVERRVSLRTEGGDPQRHGNDACQLCRQRNALVNVRVRLPREADHQVKLEPIHSIFLGELGASRQMTYARAALEAIAQPLARAIHRGRQRACSCAGKRADELVVQTIRPERRQPDFAPLVREPSDDLRDAWMVTHRGPHEPDATRIRGHELENPFHGREPHPPVGRAAHHAVRARARAAPLGLHEEHVGEDGVRGSNGSPSGQEGVVDLGNPGEGASMELGDEDVREARERLELSRPTDAIARLELAEHANDELLGFSHDHGISDPGERKRIGERKGSPRNDEGMPPIPLAPLRRETRRLEEAHETGNLELVGYADGNDGECLERPLRLVCDRMCVSSVRFVPIVAKKDPLAGKPVRFHDRAVDALITEGAHGRGVGRWVSQRDGERRLLRDASGLVGKAPSDAFAEGHDFWCEQDRIVVSIPLVLRDFPAVRKLPRRITCAAEAPLANALFRTKSPEQLVAEAEAPERRLKRSLGPLDLTALGVGATIGAGIFALTGTAAAGQQTATSGVLDTPIIGIVLGQVASGRPAAGPAIMISFLLVATACAFAGLCYAELAAMIPVAGSAYTYAYATLGELFGWIIGWDLILEYAVGNIVVASSWSGYMVKLVYSLFGLKLPLWLVTDPTTAGHTIELGAKDATALAPYSTTTLPSIFGHSVAINLPAFLIVAFLTWLLIRGIRESAAFNTAAVIFKVGVVVFFIAFGAFYVNPVHWHPFAPNGVSGVLSGAAIVFFAFIGFDAVSTAAEESKNPQRDMPIGILASLAICVVLYIAVSAVLTGMTSYTRFVDDAAAIATAVEVTKKPWVEALISAGALAGMTSVLLVFQLGQPRIFMSMARDGLLPRWFSKVHPVYRTPHVTTIVTGVAVAVPAAFADIGWAADLTNIGTFFAFVLVCGGVVMLRRVAPERARPFRCPFVPVFPLLGIGMCGMLMLALPLVTWLRFFGWLAVGLVIYFLYGKDHSTLGHSTPLAPPRPTDDR
jgi:APA family basic amino acid/polyamine antiporter